MTSLKNEPALDILSTILTRNGFNTLCNTCPQCLKMPEGERGCLVKDEDEAEACPRVGIVRSFDERKIRFTN